MTDALQATPADSIDRENRRPYAPTANVLAVVERVRRINLPEMLDTDFLRVAGIPEGTLGRVAEALRFLRLTDMAGRPTDTLRAIARAPDDESRELLAALVRDVYAADFQRVDPAQDPQARIEAQFRRYEPRSQTTRMVMLFLGLCRASGMDVLESPRERQMQAAPRTGSTRSNRATSSARPVRASQPRADRSRSQPEPTGPAVLPGLLFGVTVDDIAALPEEDFDSVWAALGKVARARARSLQGVEPTDTAPEEEPD